MSNQDGSGASQPDEGAGGAPVEPIEPIVTPITPPVSLPVEPIAPPPVQGGPVLPGPVEPITRDSLPDGSGLIQTGGGPGTFHAMGAMGPGQFAPPTDRVGTPAPTPSTPGVGGPQQAADDRTPTAPSPAPAPSSPTPPAPPSGGTMGGGGSAGGGGGSTGGGGGPAGAGELSSGMDVTRARQIAASLEHSARGIQDALSQAQNAVRALGAGWRGADFQAFEREWASTRQTIVGDLNAVKTMIALTRQNADAQQSTSAH